MKKYSVFLHLQDDATGHRGDLATVYFADSLGSLEQMVYADYEEYLLYWKIMSIEDC
jgi:hypothetical protein